MRDRGVGSDDEVDILHHRRTIQERIGSRIKIISQALDRELAVRRLHLNRLLILHETDQPNPIDCRKRRETGHWDRSF